MAKKNRVGLDDWLRQDEVLGYIINAYEGVETAPSNPRVMRRVFLWEESGDVKMGNTEAFTLHLGRHFGRAVKRGDASAVHKLLRDLGESISPHRQHASPRADSPQAGRFRQPEPDEWTIRRGPSPKKKGGGGKKK